MENVYENSYLSEEHTTQLEMSLNRGRGQRLDPLVFFCRLSRSTAMLSIIFMQLLREETAKKLTRNCYKNDLKISQGNLRTDPVNLS